MIHKWRSDVVIHECDMWIVPYLTLKVFFKCNMVYRQHWNHFCVLILNVLPSLLSLHICCLPAEIKWRRKEKKCTNTLPMNSSHLKQALKLCWCPYCSCAVVIGQAGIRVAPTCLEWVLEAPTTIHRVTAQPGWPLKDQSFQHNAHRCALRVFTDIFMWQEVKSLNSFSLINIMNNYFTL